MKQIKNPKESSITDRIKMLREAELKKKRPRASGRGIFIDRDPTVQDAADYRALPADDKLRIKISADDWLGARKIMPALFPILVLTLGAVITNYLNGIVYKNLEPDAQRLFFEATILVTLLTAALVIIPAMRGLVRAEAWVKLFAHVDNEPTVKKHWWICRSRP